MFFVLNLKIETGSLYVASVGVDFKTFLPTFSALWSVLFSGFKIKVHQEAVVVTLSLIKQQKRNVPKAIFN